MNKVNLMLDSGAFSAWVRQVEINIDEYAKYCLERSKYIDYVVNLDVIPGKWGQKDVGGDEVEESARIGFDNYYYLLDKGVPKEKLIHVFHQNEDFKWLIKMVKEIEYIGLSPANDRSTMEKKVWLDRCMDYVTDSKGVPVVKFHGFGVTSVPLMLRYPWYSVDSTRWNIEGKLGRVFLPQISSKGKYLYDRNLIIIGISSLSPFLKESNQHFGNVSCKEREIMLNYFTDKGYKVGKSKVYEEDGEIKEEVIEEGLCNDYKQRSQLNAIYFIDFAKSRPEWPWAFKKLTQKKFGMKKI